MKKYFNLADLFELVSDVVPEREAVVCIVQSYLCTARIQSESASKLFCCQGVKRNQHVGLYLYNCNEYIEKCSCFKIRYTY